MEMIEYKNDMDKEILKTNNIVIEQNAQLEDGVLLSANVCVLGECVIKNRCKIFSNSVLKNVCLYSGVEVKSSYLEDCVIGANTTVGPFAHIRNHSEIGDDCRIGNFVEIKNSIIGSKTKIAHLTYVGDAVLGENCNIGCGVVFCNYNGQIKQTTIVGNDVFVGSNVNLIAPIVIGDKAYIAAGSTINKDVLAEEFSIARKRQTNKKGFKNPYIEKLKKDKN